MDSVCIFYYSRLHSNAQFGGGVGLTLILLDSTVNCYIEWGNCYPSEWFKISGMLTTSGCGARLGWDSGF